MSAATIIDESSDLRLRCCHGSLRICRRRDDGCPELLMVKLYRYSVRDPVMRYCHLTPQQLKYPSLSYSERYFRRIPRVLPSILPGSSFDLLELQLRTPCL